MIEYLHDAIRATAGENICVCAKITDENGEPITENCHIMIYDDLSLLGMYKGAYDGEAWDFAIPSTVTTGLKGRYRYCICADNTSICFRQPIYFV